MTAVSDNSRPDYLSLRLAVEGCEYVRYGGRTYLAEPGDLMVFLPYCDFEYAAKDDSSCLIRSITLKGKLLETFLEHSALKEHCFLHLENPDFFLNIFYRIRELFTSEKPVDLSLNAGMTFQLLQKLSDLADHRRIPELLQKIRHYIDRNLDRDLSLGSLAAVSHCSAATINHLFRRYLNRSTHRYIMECRMVHAREMLLGEDLSIKETAAELGFRSAFNFSTQFKKYFGDSPRSFLRKHPHCVLTPDAPSSPGEPHAAISGKPPEP